MHSYRRLLTLVWPRYRVRLLAGLITGILFAATNSAIPVIAQQVLKNAFVPDHPLAVWQIAAYAFLPPAVLLLRGVLSYLNGYLMSWVGLHVVMDLRNKLFAHLHDLSLDFYTATPVGELISRVTNDSELVRKSVSTSLADLCKEPFSVVGMMGALLWLDWRFTIVAMLVFPLSVVPISIYGRKVRRATRRSQENLAQLVSILHENFTGVRIVKAFCMEAEEIAKFRDNTRQLIRQTLKIVRASEMVGPLMEFMGALGLAVVFIYAYSTGMTFDKFFALGIGMFLLYQPVKKLSKVQMTLEQSVAGADRVYEIIDTKPAIVNKPGAKCLLPMQDKIVFDHVSFRYDKTTVLQEISFEVPAGKVFAIVGATGSGKTTLVNLIPRFYDPFAGRITLDGHDLREVTMESLRRQIGIVSQETILFDDTVANNIAYGRPGATREQVIAAAKRAHADEFVQAMPQGYDTIVGDKGMRISGGERQRLAIARALLKNAPVLILDEATSALDSQTEKLVQAAIDELMRGRTVFAIAHRLSTVQRADRILVIEHGRIVESGTHAELLARGGIYKKLHNLQFEA